MSDIAQSRNTLLPGLTISVIHAAALAVAAGAVLTACGGGAGDAPAPVAAGPAPSPAPAPSPSPSPSPSPAGVAMLGSCPSFPATSIFNTRVDDRTQFPPPAQSDT